MAGGKRTNDNTVGELAQKLCDVTGLGSAHVAPKAGTMKYGQGVCASNGHGEREKVLLFESLQRLLDKFCPFYFFSFLLCLSTFLRERVCRGRSLLAPILVMNATDVRRAAVAFYSVPIDIAPTSNNKNLL